MTIDASTAYLPDNTWFVNGLYHGMTYWDYYTRTLMMTTLFTDRITDVYSNPDYPQFRDTSNPSSSVFAQFKGCQPGILAETDTLVVTNCSWKNSVSLSAIHCDGADIEFRINPFIRLDPGESVEIPVSGDIPKVSAKAVSLTVCFTTSTITPLGYRTQYFMLDNGDPVEESDEIISSEAKTPLDKLIISDGIDNLLKDLGLKEFLAMLFTVISYWFNFIF